MELHQLRYLSAVAHCGSAAKAAEELYISKQAVSKAIRSLAHETGFELFDRDDGMRLTENGREILVHAEAVLRELDDDHPTVHYVYVLNDYDEFVGVLSLRTLVLTDDARPVRDVMFDDVISATPDETEEDVAADIFKYELPAMPVVDEHGVLLGIVTVDDAWDAIEEDVSGDKTKATLLKVLGGLVASILFLALYTLVLLQIIGYAGR
mgnify:FL=1